MRNDDYNTEDMRVSPYSLLLKLGSLYLEFFEGTEKAGEISVAVSESEVWLLRTKVNSADKMQGDNLFGVRLLCKIYRALMTFNATDDLPDAGTDGEALTEDKKRALRRYTGKE